MNKFLILITLMVSLSACSNDLSSSDSSNFELVNISVVPSLSVKSGANAQVVYILTPTNASKQYVSFSSSDTSVARVDGNGNVTGVAYGKAIINVTSNDGSGIRRIVYVNVENAVDEKCSTFVDGIELVGDVYHIYNATGLHAFRDYVNKGNFTANARLRCNIELEYNKSWVAIVPDDHIRNSYGGTFDGDNYTISGLYNYDASPSSSSGISLNSFIYAIGDTGVVKNLTFDNPFLINTDAAAVVAISNYGLIDNVSVINGNVVANATAGGIVNGNFGTISSCYNSSNIFNAVSDSGIIKHLGGIAGDNRGTIIASYNAGTIVAKSSNESKAGGIAGGNYGEIIASYNSGDIESFSIAGGIVGENSKNDETGTVIASYNVGQLNLDNANLGGVVGKNTDTGVSGQVSSSYYLRSAATKGIADAIGGDVAGVTDNVSTIGGFVSSTAINALNNALPLDTNYIYVRNEFEDAATRPLIVIAK